MSRFHIDKFRTNSQSILLSCRKTVICLTSHHVRIWHKTIYGGGCA